MEYAMMEETGNKIKYPLTLKGLCVYDANKRLIAEFREAI